MKLKRNFNSIKVRLKLGNDAVRLLDMLFQFHKGTIKTQVISIRLVSLHRFQFHKGTIKTFINCLHSIALTISIP